MNGIFAIEKPSGVSSSLVVLLLQRLFDNSDVFAKDLAEAKQKVHEQLTVGTKWLASKIANRVKKTKIKVGHGGTLDPLALGVMIIGVGTGTKKLLYYLGECTKTYESRALLGQSTTTGDSEGEVTTQTETAHVTLDDLKKAAMKFVGKSKQTPPVYSALKVDGKPLYEYAREGIPVPRAILARDIHVYDFQIHDDFEKSSKYKPLQPLTMAKSVFNNPTLDDHEIFFSEEFQANPEYTEEDKNTKIEPKLLDPSLPAPEALPAVHLTAKVGSGTYIRSLISDLGRAVGSSAHMVELIRTKQSDWELGKNVFSLSDFTDRDERIWGPVLKSVLERGASIDLVQEFKNIEEIVLPMLEKEKQENATEAEGGKEEKENGEIVNKTINTEKSDQAKVTENDEELPDQKRQKTEKSSHP